MTHKACAMQGCPNSVGAVPYKLFKHDAEFCSRRCINDFVDARDGKKGSSSRECATCGALVRLDAAMRTRDGRVYHQTCASPLAEDPMMNIPAPDFGPSGVTRKVCDRRACGNPINLCWKGRSGEYCSNQCLKIAEKGQTTMTTDTETTAPVSAPASPIAAGAPSTKSKKAPSKKAPTPAPKPAPKSKPTPTSPVGRSAYANDMTIKVLKTDHGLKGKRGDAMDCLKDGMTVEKLKAALTKKDLGSYAGFVLKTAIGNKMVTVK